MHKVFKNWQRFMAQSAINMMNNPVIKASSVWQRRFGQRALSTVALSAILMNGFANSAIASWPKISKESETDARTSTRPASPSHPAPSSSTPISLTDQSDPADVSESRGQKRKYGDDKRHDTSSDTDRETSTHLNKKHAPNKDVALSYHDHDELAALAQSAETLALEWLRDNFLEDNTDKAPSELLDLAFQGLVERLQHIWKDETPLRAYNLMKRFPLLSALPSELQTEIAKYLSPAERNLLALTSKQMFDIVTHNQKAHIDLTKMNPNDFNTLHDPESFFSMRLATKTDVTLNLSSQTTPEQLETLVQAMPKLANLTLIKDSGIVCQVLKTDPNNPNQLIANFDNVDASSAITILKNFSSSTVLKIKNLTFDCSNTNDNMMNELASALERFDHLALLTLDLSDTQASITNIITAINAMTKLSHLDLNFFNSLNSENADVTNVAEMLQLKTSLTSLALNFGENELDFDQIQTLTSSTQTLTNLEYLNLDFWNCGITQEGMSHIANMLAPLSALEEVRLYLGDNELDDGCLSTLADALQLKTNLKKLYLSLDNAGNPENLHHLERALLPLTNLTSLGLDISNHNNINDDENIVINQQTIFSITRSIAHLSQLKDLELNFTESTLSRESIANIGHTLIQLGRLKNLKLYLDNSIPENELFAVVDIATALRQMNLTRLELNLNTNNIWSQLTDSIFYPISIQRKLTHLTLNISRNDLSQNNISSLLTMLQNLPKLKSLDLDLSENTLSDENVFSAQDILTLLNHLEQNPLLTSFSLDLSGHRFNFEMTLALHNLAEEQKKKGRAWAIHL